MINKLIWEQYHIAQKVRSSFKCSDFDSTYYGTAIINKTTYIIFWNHHYQQFGLSHECPLGTFIIK